MAEGLAPFDPEWLAAEQMMGGRTTLPAEPADQSRARFEGIFAGIAPLIPPPTDAVKAEDVQITPTQRVRIFTPTAGTKPLPVGLYIHCGGWYAGAIEAEDYQCRLIAEKAQIMLFSPEYRLAPENPYPAGLDDCCAAYEFMNATAAKYGGDPKKKFVMGGSAGGNLAACVALRYTANPELKPAGLLAAVMMSCDPRVMPEEYKQQHTPEKYTDSPMIGPDIVNQARIWYNAPQPEDPLYSPLLHPDIKLLSQVYVVACTKDPTHQETRFFYDECKKQGVNAEYYEYVGWPHFFWIVHMLPKSTEFMDRWCEKLKSMIAAAA